MSKLTFLVRARDLFPQVTAPGEGFSFWRFTSKLFRFVWVTHLKKEREQNGHCKRTCNAQKGNSDLFAYYFRRNLDANEQAIR